ncbi:MAG: HAD-IIB family hydrolase [Synechococcus sp.]
MSQLSSPLQPLPAAASSADWRSRIQVVATDMDGTLTETGKFSPSLLTGLCQLKQQGIRVLVVTGRSAGWVSGLVNYLDVAGAIAENGGIYYPSEGETAGTLLVDIDDMKEHRRRLQLAFERLKLDFPQLQPATDNTFRLTDWTFANTGFAASELEHMQNLCVELGWGFTYSSIQCHIKPLEQEKGWAVLHMAQRLVPHISSDCIVTVGDSPNDESLFVRKDFPHSVGVANLMDFSDRLHHQPAYLTSAAEGSGFCELVAWLLEP